LRLVGACGKIAAVPGTRKRAEAAAEMEPGETGARMNLEQEIIAIEESADAVAAAARTEAKRLMGSLDDRRKEIRDEIAARVEEEKARMKRECDASLKSALAGIAAEQARGEAAVEKVRGARVSACVRGIIEAL